MTESRSLVVMFLLVCSCSLGAGASLAKLPDAAISTWTRGNELPNNLSVSVVSKTTVVIKGNSSNSLSADKYLICAPNYLVAFLDEAGDGKALSLASEIMSRTEYYSFRIERQSVPDKSQYLLSEFGATPDHTYKKIRSNVKSHILGKLNIYVVTGGIALSDLATSPKYQILGTDTIQRDGNSFLRVNFRCPEQPKDDMYIVSGYCDLDEHSSWTCPHAKFTRNEGPKSVEYTLNTSYVTVAGCKLIQRREVYGVDKGDVRNTISWVTDYEYSTDKIDEAQFFLSYYGLPEPEGVSIPRKATSIYLWLLLAAAILAVLAAAFRTIQRRWTRVTNPIAPPPTR